jgi:hypothetical protein
MSRELWAAVESLATTWQSSEAVQRYTEVFRDPRQPLGHRLREIFAGAAEIQAQRLRAAHLLPVSSAYDAFVAEPGADQFLQRGDRLARAFLWTVEWWRSRLPGYPNLPTQQLVRDGPLTTREFTLRVPWLDELRRQRLQLTPAPPAVADLLDIPSHLLDEAARAVGAALERCPQVRTLTQTDAELTPNDRAALAGARSTARAALRPEQIDAKAGDQVLDRLNYREVVVAEALDSLHDGARRYDDAFRLVDRLIEQAAALFSQAVVNGPAPRVGPVLRCERMHAGSHDWAEVVVPEPCGLFAELGDVVMFNTPALPDAMHVEGITSKIKLERWGTATFAGRLLPDSAGLHARWWLQGSDAVESG